MRIAAAIGNANFVEAGSLIKIAIYSGLGSGVVAALFIIPLAYIPPIFSFFIPYSTSNSVPVRGERKGACDHVGVSQLLMPRPRCCFQVGCPATVVTSLQGYARPYWILSALTLPFVFASKCSLGSLRVALVC